MGAVLQPPLICIILVDALGWIIEVDVDAFVDVDALAALCFILRLVHALWGILQHIQRPRSLVSGIGRGHHGMWHVNGKLQARLHVHAMSHPHDMFHAPDTRVAPAYNVLMATGLSSTAPFPIEGVLGAVDLR